MSASESILALAVTTALGLAGGCAYAALSAGSQIFGGTLIANRNPNEIALTFDDGPNDPYTEQLLEVLDHHQVRASFFMIGRFVRERTEIVRAVRAAGHLIGNHTMTHPWLVITSPTKVRQELSDCNRALEDVLGEKVTYFRPPHGSRRPDVLHAARELGLIPVMWNVMGYDWKLENAAAAIDRHVERGIQRNRSAGRSSNIVLHDGGQQAIGQDRRATVEAVRRLIPRLVREGAKFTTVDSVA